ncbi:unnamed protein product, partial [Brenthis ino]
MHFLYCGVRFCDSGAKMDFVLKVLLIVMVVWTNKLTAAPRKPRLSLAAQSPSYYFKDVDGILGTYSFGYDVRDQQTGNIQFRTEEKYPNGTVVGSYGYVDPTGKSQRFDYVADGEGLLHGGSLTQNYEQSPSQIHTISTEPSISWSRPRKPHKKKTQPLKTLSNILVPPRFTVID